MKYSRLNLLGYVIPEISCKANAGFNPSKDLEMQRDELRVENKITDPDADGDWMVQVIVEQVVKDKQNFPYSFKTVAVGAFRIDQPESKEADRKLVSVNGSSILFGVIREQIRSLTANGPWNALIIPSVCFTSHEDSKKVTPARPKPALKTKR